LVDKTAEKKKTPGFTTWEHQGMINNADARQLIRLTFLKIGLGKSIFFFITVAAQRQIFTAFHKKVNLP